MIGIKWELSPILLGLVAGVHAFRFSFSAITKIIITITTITITIVITITITALCYGP